MTGVGTRETIERSAIDTLRDVRIHVPPVNLALALQGSDSFPYLALDMPRDMDGALVSGLGTHVVAANPRLSFERRRFTVAHMLGHLLLHDGMPRACSMARAPLFYEDREESEASLFAAFLLMPRTWCEMSSKRGKTVEDMAAIFKVSPQAMKIHLLDLGIVAPEQGCIRDLLQYFSLATVAGHFAI